MEDDKIQKLMKELFDECKKRDCRSLLLVANKDCDLTTVGTVAKYYEVMYLLANFLKHVQDETKLPSVNIVIYLAMVMGLNLIKPEFNRNITELDTETITKLGEFLKGLIDDHISDVLLEKGQKMQGTSPILQ